MSKQNLIFVLKCIIAIAFSLFIPVLWFILWLIMDEAGIWTGIEAITTVVISASVLALLFANRKKPVLICSGIAAAAIAIIIGINLGLNAYDNSLIVDTSPDININEYLPYQKSPRLVRLDSPASLQLSKELPILDGAAAVFPVYSAFVGAVYPDHIRLGWSAFQYNNTPLGYQKLARKETDIFFGAYPSANQIDYANSQGTEFVYTPIGSEAFVFIVHRDNPVNGLTSEQVRGIYSGQITNWKEVGGRDEPIVAYQRNEGSGSQSRLLRFMNETPLMTPPSDQVSGMMGGLITQVSDYKSKPGSIGFSFRYYVEEIIQNPDIKMLSIDGITPSAENIKNGSYPLTEPLYAVSWKGNENKNVDALLAWILSEEGQYIIEKTGYVGVIDHNSEPS